LNIAFSRVILRRRINEGMNEGVRPFKDIVRLYWDSNLRDDEMKEDSPVRG